MSKSTRKRRSINRESIVKMAAQLFIIEGYHGASISAIASKMGVTKPALYYYFRNKREILREITNRTIEPANKVIEIGRSDLPPKNRLRKIITTLIKTSAEMPETTLITFEMSNILPVKDRNLLRQRHKEVEEVVYKTIEEGVAQGLFRTKNIKIATFAILGASNSIYRWYSPKGMLTPTKIANQFIDLLANGYLKK
ncbi:MAG: TetR/AcrR family transcriptional regulator [Dehalococcoidia bacterium]